MLMSVACFRFPLGSSVEIEIKSSMIKILNKQDCCVCFSCSQTCTKKCISMLEDKEGFCYPHVNEDVCIDCHLCEKVCPVLHIGNLRKPLRTYAAKNTDKEVRMASSSGGIFTLLAEMVIAEGGVVFGARFNESWEVVHDYTETKEGLVDFRGSKYMQSVVGSCFIKAEFFLKMGRKVLFSGTPCQIAGLKLYLCKEYDNLLTVDFICHGVPSPKVWRRYLKEQVVQVCKDKDIVSGDSHKDQVFIKGVSFRSKYLGWRNYSLTLTFSICYKKMSEKMVSISEPLMKNPFLRGFLCNLYLRPSCYYCPTKCLKSGSDVTVGDYWAIKRKYIDFDDRKGISSVFVNTVKGSKWTNRLQWDSIETTYQEAYQRSIQYSVKENDKRKIFFEYLEDENITIAYCVKKFTDTPFVAMFKNRIKRMVKILFAQKYLF